MDELLANARLPFHLMDDLPGYTVNRLTPDRRRLVRKCLRDVDVIAMNTPDLLLEQGYYIVREAHERNPGIPFPKPASFKRLIISYFEPPRGLVIAALRGQELLGFSLNYAAESTAYCHQMWIGNQAANSALALCLCHVITTVVQDNPTIVELANGLHLRENAGLTAFKRRIGFDLKPMPARVWLAPGADYFLQALHPHRRYRLTGRRIACLGQRLVRGAKAWGAQAGAETLFDFSMSERRRG